MRFIGDAAAFDTSAARLWVSEDPRKLHEQAESLAMAIVNEVVSADMRGRQLLRVDSGRFLEDLAADQSGGMVERVMQETATSRAVLVFPRVERLVVMPTGMRFLDALCDSFTSGAITRFIGTTDHSGIDSLLSEHPRFAALVQRLRL